MREENMGTEEDEYDARLQDIVDDHEVIHGELLGDLPL